MKTQIEKLDRLIREIEMDEYLNEETLPKIREAKGLLNTLHEQCNIANVSNFVLLAKPNYKAKDGTIKRGIEIDGKYYAPQNDC